MSLQFSLPLERPETRLVLVARICHVSMHFKHERLSGDKGCLLSLSSLLSNIRNSVARLSRHFLYCLTHNLSRIIPAHPVHPLYSLLVQPLPLPQIMLSDMPEISVVPGRNIPRASAIEDHSKSFMSCIRKRSTLLGLAKQVTHSGAFSS